MRLSLTTFTALCAWSAVLACSSSDGKGSGVETVGGDGGSGNGGSSATGGTTTGGTSSGGSGATSGTGGASGGTGGVSGSGGTTGGTGGLTTGGTGGGSCPVTTIDGGCAGELYVGETIPLDIYIMFDQSGSMLNDDNNNGLTRLDEVRNAVGAFLNDQASYGIGVGIGYFGYMPLNQTCADAKNCTSCDPADYDNAEVGIAPLPGNAQAIIDSLASKTPQGETPTGAAIRGACTYATDYKVANPSHEVVILLVTDGKPEAPITCGGGSGACCPTIQDAVAATTDCLNGTPGLKTYVLGLDGTQSIAVDGGTVTDLGANLQQIAVAGGTDMAYLVSASGDASTDVLNALNAIRSSAQIPCDLAVPPPPSGTTLDYQKVNIIRTSATCETQTLYYTTTIDQCDPASGGWYYDDPNSPTQIHLCPKTCDDVSIPGGQLTFSLGCDTIIR